MLPPADSSSLDTFLILSLFIASPLFPMIQEVGKLAASYFDYHENFRIGSRPTMHSQ
jgi:hypothetical protein